MVTKKKKYISLKQASKISGYSADYIGYLIRTGKIEGRPVFTNIAWQTTPEAILAYKNKEHHSKKRNKSKYFFTAVILWLKDLKTAISREVKIIFLFFKYFKKFLIIFSLIVALFIVVGIFIFQKNYHSNLNNKINKPVLDNTLSY